MAIRLRDGTETRDPRLDRLIQFDERSRQYDIAPLVQAVPLKGKTWPCALYLNQGSEGACVGFGWTHEFGASPVPHVRDNQYARTQIYWEAQRIDPWAGGAYPGAQPFYEGTSVLAGAKVAQRLGYIRGYRWAFNIDDVMRAIVSEGPVVFGLPWLDTMFDPDGRGLLDCSGTEAGGHCILGRGLRVKSGIRGVREPVVRCRNSWGDDWGQGGDCLIRVSDLERLLRMGGEACVPVDRQKVA